MGSLTELFCQIDDFCRLFEPGFERRLLAGGSKKRRRQCELGLSELMTLAVLFHQLRFRQFKCFYLHYARRHLLREFPRLPSYQRCVEIMPRCAVPFAALFDALKGRCDGVSIVDATAPWPSATTAASDGTACSKARPRAARPPWAGSYG